ncbi:CpsD/CapB family tyrosine-protein kinase [Carnobacterium maltaromaticum]|uniref:CpsD/CapB family tyrosine-protein kinase n=1 Tax=Carnobacterium maltaromaticum TaxID=2751 RepID=UPI00191BA529|nr:CpsD/CapB family tyrosine-protein kinase [Carnobacterium maltaromaticum]CAD5902908.1 putative tyrosine-protein kinase YveL [Carnobacterium maltaromaticum]
MRRQEAKAQNSAVNNKNSYFDERVREIMTNLQFMKMKNQQTYKSLVITSSHKGEGKSFCALHLALAYAKQNKKVLLIDSDMHKPSLSKMLNVQSVEGLSTILNSNDDPMIYIKKTKFPNLYILAAGIQPSNPLALLNSSRLQDLVVYYKEKFDMVLIDTPPVLLINDSRVVGNACDGVLLVVRSGITKSRDLEKAMSLLTLSESKVIGTILNGKKIGKKERLQYSYE